MSTLAPIKYARSNREIAKALGIVLPRQRNRLRSKLSEINGWRAEADFPKAVKGKGFEVLSLLTWAAIKAHRVGPEKLAKAAIGEVLGSERPGVRAIKILKAEGQMLNAETGGPRKTASERGHAAGPVPSQAGMAVELHRRYGLPIKRQTVCNWIHGIHLPKDKDGRDAPRFPSPDPGRAGWNNPAPCFAWYERWIVEPTKNAYAGNEVQGNLFERKRADATLAEFEEQIDKARKARSEADALEREVSDKWILREAAVATAARALNDLLHIVKREHEGSGPRLRAERLRALVQSSKFKVQSSDPAPENVEPGTLNPELIQEFTAWDLQEERGRFDRIKAACARLAAYNTERGEGTDSTEGNEGNEAAYNTKRGKNEDEKNN